MLACAGWAFSGSLTRRCTAMYRLSSCNNWKWVCLFATFNESRNFFLSRFLLGLQTISNFRNCVCVRWKWYLLAQKWFAFATQISISSNIFLLHRNQHTRLRDPCGVFSVFVSVFVYIRRKSKKVDEKTRAIDDIKRRMNKFPELVLLFLQMLFHHFVFFVVYCFLVCFHLVTCLLDAPPCACFVFSS